MPPTFWTCILLALTTLLASCGGGGGAPSPATAQQTTSETCDSNLLWAAHPATSGSTIPDNNETGISVRWDNQNCNLRTVSTATLEVCLKHPKTSDLAWTITPPTGLGALTLNPPADWNTSGTDCGSDGEKLQRIDLLPTVFPTLTTRGIWTLHVKDQLLGDTGSLVRWRLVFQGTL
ncbi:proprotein convertase P-domain-containing protein [Limnohabitans sp. DCL3]|uniref:proprotein convertase P-domain-containing protein n=1 Tax=Limnohabitans sp. DCL3 TaxID=3374103 RepID=UPI003A87E3F9